MSAALAPWLLPAWQRFVAALAEDRLGHGLLLAGEPGLGKRALAAAMVARLLCERAGGAEAACGACRGCAWRLAGSHPDLHLLAPEEDAKAIKVAQVRALIARLQLTGQASSTRIALVDPADAMNAASQNALLKTLEEPSPGVVLLLVSDGPGRLLATVRIANPGPPNQLRAGFAANAQKRLLLSIARPAAFPEVRDLGPGEDFSISLPDPPPRSKLEWPVSFIMVAMGLALIVIWAAFRLKQWTQPP